MGFIKTVLRLAGTVLGIIADIPGAFGQALHYLLNLVSAIHALIAHLIGTILRDLFWEQLLYDQVILGELHTLYHALQRVGPWIKVHLVTPLYKDTLRRIALLRADTLRRISAVRNEMIGRIALVRKETLTRLAGEAKARETADRAEHEAMLKQVANALATVQTEAASGYKAGNSQRMGAINKLIDELANHNPAVKGLVSDLVKLIVDILGAENPVERAAITFLLTQIIDKLGIDKVAGTLLSALLGDLIGNPNPGNLHDVTKDLASRISTLENQWSDYMADGGPELHQAGHEWKALSSLTADAALLAFFGFAVVNPDAWAKDVAGTAGALVNGTIGGVSTLIRKA